MLTIMQLHSKCKEGNRIKAGTHSFKITHQDSGVNNNVGIVKEIPYNYINEIFH